MELVIKNTANKVVRTLKTNTWLYCIEKALYYKGYDMRFCYKDGTIILKQRDIKDFVIYLKAFTKAVEKQKIK